MTRLEGIEFDLVQAITDLIHEMKLLEQRQAQIDERIAKIENNKE